MIQRFLNAATEYYEAGGVDGVTRALLIDEGEVKSTQLWVLGAIIYKERNDEKRNCSSAQS